ncbi:protein FAM216A [Dendropsophus ebraccatus]|uniref:protein FAM216A n=1 Tax=Dendropsophus ebraccatus TaxID=150705 RepID=UPI0038310521
MERHTSCSVPNSRKKLLVRSVDMGHKDPEEGTRNDIISKDSKMGCRLQIVPLRQQVKTIKIPRAMKNEAFLKHPDLTMGQKRYLCSIARIYSTSNMREMTEKHRHSQIKSGSKKAHLNPSASGKHKNEIKGHSRSVQTETTTAEASKTIEDMREQITCLSMN